MKKPTLRKQQQLFALRRPTLLLVIVASMMMMAWIPPVLSAAEEIEVDASGTTTIPTDHDSSNSINLEEMEPAPKAVTKEMVEDAAAAAAASESSSSSSVKGAKTAKKKPRLVTEEELATKKGVDGPEIWISLMGEVYDVSSGSEYYGPGNGYSIFAGRDGPVPFITGVFTEEEANKTLKHLTNEQLAQLNSWRGFYQSEGKYPFVGLLVGKYYDEHGKPTKSLKRARKRIRQAAKDAALAKFAKYQQQQAEAAAAVAAAAKEQQERATGGGGGVDGGDDVEEIPPEAVEVGPE